MRKPVPGLPSPRRPRPALSSIFSAVLAFVAVAVLTSAPTPVSAASDDFSGGRAAPDPIYQISVINALLEGIYEGVLTIGDLKAYGDFGLGTVASVDGEMLAEGGLFFRVRDDGTAYPLEDGDTTPFAVVTFFRPEQRYQVDGVLGQAAAEALFLRLMGTTNAPYALRVSGTFPYVKTRSVARQDPPYPRLADVTANQAEFEFFNAHGTMVGFWTPGYLDGLNVPGFHFHWISGDLSSGGHVLAYEMGPATIELDEKNLVVVELPLHLPVFRDRGISTQVEGELERIER